MWKALHVSPDSKAVHLLKRFNTFLLVCFGWIFFRANSFGDLTLLLKKLFTDWRFDGAYFTATLDSMGLTLTAILTSVLSLLVLQRLDVTQLDSVRANGKIALPVSRYVLAVWVIALAWVLLLAGDGASSFIYFQF